MCWLELHAGHDPLAELIHGSCGVFAIGDGRLVQGGEVEGGIFDGAGKSQGLDKLSLQRNDDVFEGVDTYVVASLEGGGELLLSVLAVFTTSVGALLDFSFNCGFVRRNGMGSPRQAKRARS